MLWCCKKVLTLSSCEFFHSGGSSGVDAFRLQDVADGEQEDTKIKDETHMVYIPDIVCKFLLPANGIAAIYLGPPSDARLHRMAPCLVLII